MTCSQDISLYRSMYQIRRFEEMVLDNFQYGVFFGTTHTYLGQEANAVGILNQISVQDIVFSNHRCHGHFLAYGGDPRALFAELMGKETGVCGGRGGSQHLHWKNFFSNGVQGGTIPIATGAALAEKLSHSEAVVIAFLGDGTLGEGVIYEAFNIASLWKIPILYVLENNRIAQTTPIELSVSGTLAGRFQAFSIPTTELETSDVHEIAYASNIFLKAVRSTQSPRALILNTYRFGPHSKGDDTRPPQEVSRLRHDHDPLLIHAQRLNEQTIQQVRADIDDQLSEAYRTAVSDPFPKPLSSISHSTTSTKWLPS